MIAGILFTESTNQNYAKYSRNRYSVVFWRIATNDVMMKKDINVNNGTFIRKSRFWIWPVQTLLLVESNGYWKLERINVIKSTKRNNNHTLWNDYNASPLFHHINYPYKYKIKEKKITVMKKNKYINFSSFHEYFILLK